MSAQHLTIAGVPAELHQAALACLAQAKQRARGLLLHKLKARYLKAAKVAKLLPWDAERLIDVRPDLAPLDIEPIQHIRGYTDWGIEWVETPAGGRPLPKPWMNPDPASAEYQEAVAANRYAPGLHPRSRESRQRWYRRNGGAYEAYARGMPVDPAQGFTQRQGRKGGLSVTVSRIGDAWIVATERRIGPLVIRTRKGFEVDNVFGRRAGEEQFVQVWYAIEGHELKAPVTWSMRPALAR